MELSNQELADKIHETDTTFLKFIESAKELVCFKDETNDPKLAMLLEQYDFDE